MEVKKTYQERTPVREVLKFQLTDAEKLDYGNKAAMHYSNLLEEEFKLDRVKQEFKSRMGTIEVEHAKLMKLIKDGFEFREVDCIMIMNFKEKLVSYEFNKVIMKQRPMESYELQQKFPFDEDKKTSPAEPIKDQLDISIKK